MPIFHYLMIAATLGPLIATPVGIMGGVNDFLDQYHSRVYSLVLGSGHVAATAFFFYDRGARDIVKKNAGRFIYAPLILCAIFTAVIYATGLEGAQYLVFVNIIYLFFHYQKQNFGLISLANKGFHEIDVRVVKAIIFLPMLSGMIAYGLHILKGSHLHTVFQDYQSLVFSLGENLYIFGAIVTALFLARFWKQLNARSGLLLVSSFLFFSPLYIFADNPALAFGTFAAAHGAQYLLIMSYTIAGVRHSIVVLRAVLVICCVCLLLELLTHHYLLLGILIGLTWGHYLIDARIWKLSLPDSRKYIFSRIKGRI